MKGSETRSWRISERNILHAAVLTMAVTLGVIAGVDITRNSSLWGAFPLGLCILGAYVYLATMINTTRITLTTTALRWETGPFPSPVTGELPRADIAALRARTTHAQRGLSFTWSYRLEAISHSGGEPYLIAYAGSAHSAEQLAAEIESALAS